MNSGISASDCMHRCGYMTGIVFPCSGRVSIPNDVNECNASKRNEIENDESTKGRIVFRIQI